jgi:hypothetical protein
MDIYIYNIGGMMYTNTEIDKILKMEYNPDFKYTDENIEFNMDFFITPTEKLCEKTNIQKLQDDIFFWRYDKEKFNWGRKNIKIYPSLMIYLILATFKNNKYISLDEYTQVVLKNHNVCFSSYLYTDEQILIGRSYQTHTSYIREVDFAVKLKKVYPNVKIYKNPHMDLCEGVDFIVEKNGENKFIAIKHEGHTSEKYDRMWKNKKEELSQYEITRITAPHNKGDLIELCDISDIQQIFS